MDLVMWTPSKSDQKRPKEGRSQEGPLWEGPSVFSNAALWRLPPGALNQAKYQDTPVSIT